MILMFALEKKNKYLLNLLRKFMAVAIRTFPKYMHHSGPHPRRLPTQQMIIIMIYFSTKQEVCISYKPKGATLLPMGFQWVVLTFQAGYLL